MNMTKELRDKWVSALRSGDYAQGQKRLRQEGDTPKYCCLGVLADLVDRNGWCHAEGYGFAWNAMGYKPALLPDDVENELCRLNDQGASFDVIAAWIEANIPVEDDQ